MTIVTSTWWPNPMQNCYQHIQTGYSIIFESADGKIKQY
jgi:hypothetical protein